jgi:tryptophan synthase alpha chain
VQRLEKALHARNSAFIPYLMAGDPDLETTELLARALAKAGAAALELGIPYGDPLADGPTIQAAGQRALANGVGVREVLALTKRVATSIPVVLFTYFNPIHRYGVEAFARDAAAAGASAVIVPDVTVEELDAVQPVLARYDLAMPLLVAPTTPPLRAAQIAQRASGFVYVVSRLGVTGTGKAPYVEPLRVQVASLRAVTEKPLAVGFGISTGEHVRAVAPFVDGVIVGSALIDAYAGTRGEEAVARVVGAVQTLLAARP